MESDVICRQDTIDAINTWDKFGIDERSRVVRWREGLEPYVKLRDVIWAIEKMPSAQPEPCVDTIDALDESIKHFDDMAEECRRNANIEQNDYMDMRDDATEYRQLSIWLNELKWLRERFQSQPDLSEYSDKLWKAAYERGKAEAQQRWIPCSKRLPKPDEEVFVYLWDNVPYIASVNGEGQWDTEYFCVGVEDAPKAWMPLPEPYAERR